MYDIRIVITLLYSYRYPFVSRTPMSYTKTEYRKPPLSDNYLSTSLDISIHDCLKSSLGLQLVSPGRISKGLFMWSQKMSFSTSSFLLKGKNQNLQRPRINGSWLRCPRSTPCLLSSATVRNLLLLLLFPRVDGGLSTVVTQRKDSSARETLSILWRFTEYAKTDGADEAGVDDLAVAKAGSSKVDSIVGWRNEGPTSFCIGNQTEHEVGQQALGVGGFEEDAVCVEASLLEEC